MRPLAPLGYYARNNVLIVWHALGIKSYPELFMLGVSLLSPCFAP